MNLELSIVPPYALKWKEGYTPTMSGLVKSILKDKVLDAGMAHREM